MFMTLYDSGFQTLFLLYHQVKKSNVGVPPAKVRSKTTGEREVPLQLIIRGTS